jgi:F0F1-type ATP synthase assembly protein I
MGSENSEENKKLWWRPAMEFFGQISGWIVFPIIVALFLGRYLDNKFDRAPMFLIICVIIAFAITLFGLVRQTLKAAKKIEEQIKSDKIKK